MGFNISGQQFFQKIHFQAIIVTGLLYFIAAWAGLFFALPPGFASVVWPGAGVALALILLYGNQALIGLWIGSMLANFYVVGQGGELSFSALLLPAWIASGSTLQAFVATYLIKRFCGWPEPFESVLSTIKFFLISGPLTCVIASSIGVFGLILFVDLPLEKWGFNWFSWWVGDTVGNWFFAPVIIVFIKEKARLRGWLILIPSVLIFILICLAFIYSRENFIQNVEKQVVERADRTMMQLDQRANSITQTLQIVKEVFTKYEPSTQKAFQDQLGAIVGNRGEFTKVYWFDINEKNRIQYRLKYTYPIEEQDAASNYNRDQSYIRELIAQSQKLGRLTSITINSGVLVAPKIYIALPIYHNGNTFFKPHTPYQKEFGFYGSIVAEVNFERINEILLNAFSRWHLDVHIFQQKGKQSTTLYGQPQPYQPYSASRREAMFGEKWNLEFTHSDILPVYGKDWLSWYSLILGTLMGCAIQVLILMLTSFNIRLTNQVKIKTKDLEKMNFALVEANQIKSRFLANISHEIRTPLNAILGFCRIALSKSKEDGNKEYYSKIEESSYILSQIVNDILDISKLEKGNLKIDRKPTSVRKVLREIENLFDNEASKKGLELTFSVDDEISEYVMGDPRRLQQILMNLCSNAIKFTDHGHIAVKVSISHESNLLQFEVEDTGIGIPMKDQGDIFADFNQKDASSTRKYGGTGLGLSITHKLVSLMNGAIWLKSTDGLGSQFFVAIPYVPTDAPEQTNSNVIEFTQLKNKTILVAEDNLVNQELIKEILKNWKCYVILAVNGRDAIEQLKRNPQIDAVLMDCQMPIMDGYQATQHVRAELRWKDLPIIALTANVLPEDVDKSLKVGMNAHLGKPIDEALLYDTLVFYTGKKH